MDKEIEKLLEDYSPGMDDLQIQFFVVGSGITDYGQYRQAQAEIATRINEKKRLEREIIRLSIKKERAGNSPDELDRIDALDFEDAIDSAKKAVERLESEINVILPLARTFAESIAGQDRKELIKEYHIERLKKLLMLNTVFRGGNLSGVLDTILTLPKETQQRLIEEYQSMNIKAIKDYKEFEMKALE